jgi:hypothetical protein
MAKGVPKARSQRYKATQQAQVKTKSIPPKETDTTLPFGNDVLPSLPLNLVTTQPDDARRALNCFHIIIWII